MPERGWREPLGGWLQRGAGHVHIYTVSFLISFVASCPSSTLDTSFPSLSLYTLYPLPTLSTILERARHYTAWAQI